MRNVITIDGPAGSGKSSISALLAKKLGWINLNSGLLYRAAAYSALKTKTSLTDGQALSKLIKTLKIELKEDASGHGALYLNGKLTSEELRTPEVSEVTSKISTVPEVREALRDAQRNAFAGRPLVAEGRDMGTVIFPDAQLKIFLTVSEAARIERRINQLKAESEKNGKVLPEADIEWLRAQMKIEIQERDARDTGRKVAPLVPASDAVIIDNSSRTLEDTLKEIYELINSRRL